MDILHALRQIVKNRDDMPWWKAQLVFHAIGPLQEWYHDSSFRVMDEDWDVLIVLDGCRDDLFRDGVDISRFDKYETRISAGSATNEWSYKNFSGQALSDTIYTTANPVVSREVQTAFYAFFEVWRDGFDEDLGTVPPEAVTKTAIDTLAEHPEKRLIVHYLQPHYPFINHPELRYASFSGTDEINMTSSQTGADDVWEALDLGLVDENTVWDAYSDNLNQVMSSIDDLLSEIEGRAVITSDHGNLIGERVSPLRIPLYGHPAHIYHDSLRCVPWAVIEGQDSVSKSEPSVNVEEQLRSLGYT